MCFTCDFLTSAFSPSFLAPPLPSLLSPSIVLQYAGFTGVRLGWTVVPKQLKFKDGSSVCVRHEGKKGGMDGGRRGGREGRKEGRKECEWDRREGSDFACGVGGARSLGRHVRWT